MRSLAPLILAASCMAQAPAQDNPMSVMRGEGIPVLVKLQDIPADAAAVRLGTGDSGGGGILGTLMGGMMMPFMLLGGLLGGQASNGPPIGALQMLDVVWVLPKSVRLGNREFVATYRLELELTAGPPKPDAINYRLTYVDIDSIRSITPMPDLTREKIKEAIEALAKSGPSAATPGVAPAEAAPAAEDTEAKAAPDVPDMAMNVALETAFKGLAEEVQARNGIVPWVQSSAKMRALIGPRVPSGESALVDPWGKPLMFNVRLAGTRWRDLPRDLVVFFGPTQEPNGLRRAVLVDGSVVEIQPADWEAALGPKNLKRYGAPIKD